MARRAACRKTLKAFPREVADIVLHLVKEHHVKALMLDGAHVLLRRTDDANTLKVSRSRPARDSIRYMRGLVECEHQ
jgi:hypothetical protein